MPYDSRAYRILIASPSDVEEERELAVRVIQEWNDLYSYSRKVVLLPLRWETHTAPEYGTRPQEVINRAIVDQCDLLVGIFWARIGTPTGEADSGTLEEIARAADAGKSVMLYFSKIGVDPDVLDLEQVAQLKAFKERIHTNALTESYKSHIDFRDKLAKQLEFKVRDLQRADESGQPPPLNLQFFSVETEKLVGASMTCQAINKEFRNSEEHLQLFDNEDARKQVREVIDRRIDQDLTVPVVMAISNTSASGIRNLYVEVSISSSSRHTNVSDSIRGAASWTPHIFTLFESKYFIPDRISKIHPKIREFDNQGLSKTEEGWKFTFEWDALQPQRERYVKPIAYVKTMEDAEIVFTARVFADTFPQPLELSATLHVNVRSELITLSDILPDLEAISDLFSEAPQTGLAGLLSASKRHDVKAHGKRSAAKSS